MSEHDIKNAQGQELTTEDLELVAGGQVADEWDVAIESLKVHLEEHRTGKEKSVYLKDFKGQYTNTLQGS